MSRVEIPLKAPESIESAFVDVIGPSSGIQPPQVSGTLPLTLLTTPPSRLLEMIPKTGLNVPSAAVFTDLTRRIAPLYPAAPELMAFLSHPISQGVIASIMLVDSFGTTFYEKMTTLSHFLVIAKGESNLHYDASYKGSVLYKGRYVPTFVTGALQFTKASYKQAFDRGWSLLQHHTILRILLDAIVEASGHVRFSKEGLHSTPGADFGQVFAILGQISLLKEAGYKSWSWSSAGFIPKYKPLQGSLLHQLQTGYPGVLRNKFLGTQLIASALHINGLYSMNQASSAHKERLKSDIDYAIVIGRIPNFKEVIIQSLPSPIRAKLAITMGDPDGDEDIIGQAGSELNNYNLHIKAVYNIPFNHMPIGSGVINSEFGKVRSLRNANTGTHKTHAHGGTDLAAVTGQPVFSLTDGVVTFAANSGANSWGNAVKIDSVLASPMSLTPDPNISVQLIYGHLSKVIVEAGTSVKRGQIIGLVGSTGFSTGPHLHVEARVAPDALALLGKEFPVTNKSIDVRAFGLNPSFAVNKKNS